MTTESIPEQKFYRIAGIDPGPTKSGFVVLQAPIKRRLQHDDLYFLINKHEENQFIRDYINNPIDNMLDFLVIENVTSFRTAFPHVHETSRQIGRFEQIADNNGIKNFVLANHEITKHTGAQKDKFVKSYLQNKYRLDGELGDNHVWSAFALVTTWIEVYGENHI